MEDGRRRGSGAAFHLYSLSEARRRFPAGATSAPAQTEAAGAEETVRRNGLDQSGISDVEWQEQPITVVPNDYQE
ncbi:MAG: hypothetical protein ACLRM8_08365 [Alistipes sp.]